MNTDRLESVSERIPAVLISFYYFLFRQIIIRIEQQQKLNFFQLQIQASKYQLNFLA
nr:MAG TPA: hypothetical protein [Caudoviricetes sp.]